ncbi:MAG: iron-sulfur cluster assembly scaffold protein [Chloroflexi bacterium]|nr:iron-sulfur cluster assembly scaffold protein [Chloroflexota bacterium]
MSRIPLPYNPKVMDLFRNPKNLGKMEDATVVAVAGNPACGDMITFYLKITDKDIIERASFESYGCAANIATSSIVTEMIKGLSLEAAWKDITWKRVTEEIGGLPSVTKRQIPLRSPRRRRTKTRDKTVLHPKKR